MDRIAIMRHCSGRVLPFVGRAFGRATVCLGHACSDAMVAPRPPPSARLNIASASGPLPLFPIARPRCETFVLNSDSLLSEYTVAKPTAVYIYKNTAEISNLTAWRRALELFGRAGKRVGNMRILWAKYATVHP